MFSVISLWAESLVLSPPDAKKLADLNIKIMDIASIISSNIESKDIKSTIILGKIILDNTKFALDIYDPWEEASARMEQKKSAKIRFNGKVKYSIIILTGNHISILIDDKSKDNLVAYYPFKLKTESENKKQTYYPKDKEMLAHLLIKIPNNDGYLCYLYWNGKKYVYVWVATDDIEQG